MMPLELATKKIGRLGDHMSTENGGRFGSTTGKVAQKREPAAESPSNLARPPRGSTRVSWRSRGGGGKSSRPPIIHSSPVTAAGPVVFYLIDIFMKPCISDKPFMIDLADAAVCGAKEDRTAGEARSIGLDAGGNRNPGIWTLKHDDAHRDLTCSRV